MNEGFLFVVLGAAAFLLGLRGSIRLTRRYRAVTGHLLPRERLILGSLAIVAWVITIAAGWFDGLSILRLDGAELPRWTPFVSVVVASVVLFIPVGLDYVVNRVARVPWDR